MSPVRFDARVARKIAEADEAYFAAKRALEEAEQNRKEVRARYRPTLQLGIPRVAGGVRVLVKEVKQGASFSVAGYLERHGKVAKRMEPFFTPACTREAWTVERIPSKDTG